MALGVFLSRCGGRIESALDIQAALAGVAGRASVVRVLDDFFDAGVAEGISRDIEEHRLDAVVLAGHSEEHFAKSLSASHLRDAIVAAGVNANRVAAANILEQCALAHPDDVAGATAKARAIIDVAATRAEMAEAVEGEMIRPRSSVLILGVTAEAVVAAQRLLRLGYSVVLADREDGSKRAGRAFEMHATTSYVLDHPQARVIDSARLQDGDGYLGDFRIVLESADGLETYRVGGILLARPDHTEWVSELRQHFRVDVDDAGFARSLDPAMHPAETVDPGIMVMPLRRSDAQQVDKVAAADAAAMALVLKLSHDTVVHYRDTSAVDTALCGGCATCVRTCAFGACSISDDGFSDVDIRRCVGCGKCVVSCPVGARDIVSSPHDYLLGAVRDLARAKVEGDKVIGFLCGGCGYPAADSAASTVAGRGVGYPSSFLPLRIPCGGRLDALYVLEAFKVGFEGVCVYRCREGHCHNLVGNLDMDRRVNLLRTVLRSRNIDDARLRIIDISPFEGEHFIHTLEEVYSTIGGLANGKGGPL
ncbi:MAG: hydrogenase iron-sulfur subunit [Coriobacteriia bacterium]|nr:hydrogenase iron-sulfur subunit [Coriobacteriia bacterium]